MVIKKIVTVISNNMPETMSAQRRYHEKIREKWSDNYLINTLKMKKKNYKKWIKIDTEDYPREKKKYESSPH